MGSDFFKVRGKKKKKKVFSSSSSSFLFIVLTLWKKREKKRRIEKRVTWLVVGGFSRLYGQQVAVCSYLYTTQANSQHANSHTHTQRTRSKSSKCSPAFFVLFGRRLILQHYYTYLASWRCVQVIAALYIIYTHLYPIKISRFLFDVAATAEIVPLLLLLLLFYF